MSQPGPQRREDSEDEETFHHIVVDGITDVHTPAENTIVLEMLPGGLYAPGGLRARLYKAGRFRSIKWSNTHKTCPVAIILLACENKLRVIWGPDVDLVEHEYG